jgi:hypothetical protein
VPLNILFIFSPKFWKKLVKFTQGKKKFPKEKNWSKKSNKNLSKKKINA